MDLLRDITPRRVLCTSVGRGQFAIEAAHRFPDAHVTCHFLDLFYADETRKAGGEQNLRIVCSPDFPEETFDCVAIPVRSSGNAELTRDRLQAGHIALEIDGRMICTTDNEDDRWLHEELRKLFSKVTRRPVKEGVVYLATKTEALKKVKNFECQMAFRDREKLIQLVSRPSVFSHREVDGGARALIRAMEIGAGQKVLDMGCGSGTVALAAAARAPGVQVLAVDSDCRAIQCTAKGAELNQLTNVNTELNYQGDPGKPDSYDLVLGNPPYFSQYHIAALFLRAASRALKVNGRVMMVTKTPNWFDEHMPEMFDNVEIKSVGAYSVVSGKKGKPAV